MGAARDSIDLNCDLGESFGVYSLGDDASVVPVLSSASIACGFHAGDPSTMRRTVALCRKHGVALGAHPSYPDLQGFGRRELVASPDEVYGLVLYQVGALAAFATAAGLRLRHVKPHGALYHVAAREGAVATAVARAVADFDRELCLYGLSGSALPAAGLAVGLKVASEVFADRRYEADGSLTPRRHPDAVIRSPEEAAEQVAGMVRDGMVRSREGTPVSVTADTVCLHGDRPDAAAFARALRERLERLGLAIRPPGSSDARSVSG